MGEVNNLSVVGGVPDTVKAENYRLELRPILEQAAEVLNRAKADGLVISFSINPDQYGRYRVTEIGIVKPL